MPEFCHGRHVEISRAGVPGAVQEKCPAQPSEASRRLIQKARNKACCRPGYGPEESSESAHEVKPR